MKCSRCGYENGAEALACGMCGEVLRRETAHAPAAEAPAKKRSVWQRPYVCLAIGLVMFPLGQLLFIPRYVFNFLTTLVHECGHAVCAWLMGRPSIPTVSMAGGGITLWRDPANWQICVLVWIGIGALAYVARRSLLFLSLFGTLAVLYPFVAFTGANRLLVVGGGILFELLGAGACFVTCLGIDLKRPFERPLYATWGWWMLLNRMTEAYLILTDASYANESAVIQAGLAAGLPSDLTTLGWSVAKHTILHGILALGVLVLPLSMAIAHWLRSRNIEGSLPQAPP